MSAAKILSRLKGAVAVLVFGMTREHKDDFLRADAAEHEVELAWSEFDRRGRQVSELSRDAKEAEDEVERIRAILQDATAVHKGLLSGSIVVPSGWLYVDVPTEPPRTYGDGIREAALFVREWAVPMDSRHEASTKDLLFEIVDGIQGLVDEEPIRSAGDLVRQIREVAEAVAFQAGEPELEIAGTILSTLAKRPELVSRFMEEGSGLLVDGEIGPTTGCFSFYAVDGKIRRPEEAIAAKALRDALAEDRRQTEALGTMPAEEFSAAFGEAGR